MTRIIFYITCLSLVLFGVGCKEQSESIRPDMIYFPDGDNADPNKLPQMTFEDTLFNFGTVLEGTMVHSSFEFSNTGKVPLVLTRVEPSCGCTVANDWPRQPIQPGESGSISLSFDTDRRIGQQRKSISVVSNTFPSTTFIYLEGTVIGPPKNP